MHEHTRRLSTSKVYSILVNWRKMIHCISKVSFCLEHNLFNCNLLLYIDNIGCFFFFNISCSILISQLFEGFWKKSPNYFTMTVLRFLWPRSISNFVCMTWTDLENTVGKVQTILVSLVTVKQFTFKLHNCCLWELFFSFQVSGKNY